MTDCTGLELMAPVTTCGWSSIFLGRLTKLLQSYANILYNSGVFLHCIQPLALHLVPKPDSSVRRSPRIFHVHVWHQARTTPLSLSGTVVLKPPMSFVTNIKLLYSFLVPYFRHTWRVHGCVQIQDVLTTIWLEYCQCGVKPFIHSTSR